MKMMKSFAITIVWWFIFFYSAIVRRSPNYNHIIADIKALDNGTTIYEKAPTGTSTTPTTTSLRGIKRSLTLVVPEYGSIEHLPIMSKSIKKIQESLSTNGYYNFHCIIYAYKTPIIYETKKELPFCDVQYSVGLWTHHMLKLPYLHSYDHVAILRDDVDIYTHSSEDVTSMLGQMSKLNYNVMSAAVR